MLPIKASYKTAELLTFEQNKFIKVCLNISGAWGETVLMEMDNVTPLMLRLSKTCPLATNYMYHGH